MSKALKYIFLSAALFAVMACQQELKPGDNPSGYGSIVLKLGSDNGVSFQTKSEESELLDGLRFTNVLVILTDNTNKVVGNGFHDGLSNVTQDVITFSNILPGNYTAYAYANIDMTAWQNATTSEQIANKEKVIAVNTDFSTYLSRQLIELTGNSTPANPTTSMLLTGKKSIAVGLTAAEETIDLKRPVVRFKVTVNNNTDYAVRIDNMSFSHFNPDKAFIIGQTDAQGLPVLPDGVSYRELPAYNTSSPVTVSAGADGVVYQTYLFENASPNTYKIFADMTLMRGSVPADYLEMSIGGREFGPIDYTTLNGMDEGESVDILLVNPQKSVRSGRIFKAISTDNHLAWESCGYDNSDRLFGRAQAIYNQISGVDSYTYTEYSWSNANGYAAWDGIEANDPVGNDPSYDKKFDYAGARNTYFHSLTKSEGKYSIQGLAIGNPTSGNSIDNLTLQKGSPNSEAQGKLTSNISSYLVKFLNDSGKQLTADVNWSSDTPNKVSFLKFHDASDRQDRLFLVFGKYCTGGQLKRMLSESHKEVPLTYMSRNEEINVIINVYYADQTGEITFRVDNSTWTTATTSSHTFN